VGKLMTFFSDEDKSVTLSDEQYNVIKPALSRGDKFVIVNGQTYNVADVKAIEDAGQHEPVYKALPFRKPDDDFDWVTSDIRKQMKERWGKRLESKEERIR